MTDQEQELPGMLALAEGVNAGEWPHTMDAQVKGAWPDVAASIWNLRVTANAGNQR